MTRLEKILSGELDKNEEAIAAMKDYYISCFEAFVKKEEKSFSKANADIQKRLTGIANEDPDEIIADLYQSATEKEEAMVAIDRLNKIKAYLFEEVKEHKEVKGFKAKGSK